MKNPQVVWGFFIFVPIEHLICIYDRTKQIC